MAARAKTPAPAPPLASDPVTLDTPLEVALDNACAYPACADDAGHCRRRYACDPPQANTDTEV